MIISICYKCGKQMMDFKCVNCGATKTSKDILKEYKNKRSKHERKRIKRKFNL